VLKKKKKRKKEKKKGFETDTPLLYQSKEKPFRKKKTVKKKVY